MERRRKRRRKRAFQKKELFKLCKMLLVKGSQMGVTPCQRPSVEDIAAARENSVVTLGGKNCKWCGSSTHSRKTHKDCPHNPKNASSSS